MSVYWYELSANLFSHRYISLRLPYWRPLAWSSWFCSPHTDILWFHYDISILHMINVTSAARTRNHTTDTKIYHSVTYSRGILDIAKLTNYYVLSFVVITGTNNINKNSLRITSFVWWTAPCFHQSHIIVVYFITSLRLSIIRSQPLTWV